MPVGVQEVVHGERDVQPLGHIGGLGHPERDVSPADLLLRSRDPRRHGPFEDQERAGDIRRAHTAHESKRQRDLGFTGEGRMAVDEDQPEAVVINDRISRQRFLGHSALHE